MTVKKSGISCSDGSDVYMVHWMSSGQINTAEVVIGRIVTTHQICDNSKIGSFDLVKNSFAAEPGTQRNRWFKQSTFTRLVPCVCVCVHFPTRYEAGEVWLDGFELVNIILSLLIRDLPRIIVAAGLSLNLIGRRCWGHCSYRCAFLRETTGDIYRNSQESSTG